MTQIDNKCPSCGGEGCEYSGVEYAGQRELLACSDCCGTGFDDIALGVEQLREEIAVLSARIIPLLIDRSAAIAALEAWHDVLPSHEERETAWSALNIVRAIDIHQPPSTELLEVLSAFAGKDQPQRMSRCSSCGRTQPSDPTSKYFIAWPKAQYDSDWCGCERGSGT